MLIPFSDLLGTLHVLPQAAAQPDTFWTHNRPIPLKEKEDALKELLGQLRKVPAFNAIIKTAEILITGYIPTANDKKATKFDFGPMNTTFSANHLEGFRMRVGGMTTPILIHIGLQAAIWLTEQTTVRSNTT